MAIEVSVVFDAPIDAVWALVSDVERMAGLGPEHVAAAWNTSGPATGARFTGVNRRGDFEWSVPCTVTACIPRACIEWTVGDLVAPSSIWSYELEESPDGGTIVVERFRHGPGFSYVRMSIDRAPHEANAIIESRCASLRTGMEATLAAARRLLAEDGAIAG